MKTRKMILTAAVVTALVLSACVQSEGTSALTSRDNGQTFHFSAGTPILVQLADLASNSGPISITSENAAVVAPMPAPATPGYPASVAFTVTAAGLTAGRERSAVISARQVGTGATLWSVTIDSP